MTREEHIEWCKKRAIEAMDYENDPKQAYISMASDLRKHPETNSEALINLTMMQLMFNPTPSRSGAIEFINGFK